MPTFDFSDATIIKSLRGSPITVLFTLFMIGGQSGEKRLAGLTGYKRKTVREALNSLNHSGFVTRTHRYDGWVLTAGARQIPLSWLEALPENEAGRGKIYPSPLTTVVGEESININNKTLLLQPPKGKNYPSELDPYLGDPATIQEYETASRWCDLASFLWAEEIFNDAAVHVAINLNKKTYSINPHLPTLDDLIGWIAYAEDNRSKLDHPSRVVRANILADRRPPTNYAIHPEKYLPESFLEMMDREIKGYGDQEGEIEY